MSQIVPVIPGTLPQGSCPATLQETLNLFSQHQTVEIPDGATSGIVASATKPSDTTVTWVQLDSLGRPVRTYNFAQGAWLSLHPTVSGATMIWTSALPDFTTFDGGDANPLSATSGPMWEELVEMRARFPLGVGTLPNGNVVAVSDTGGQQTVTLTTAEMPAHTHFCGESVLGGSPSGTGMRSNNNTVESTSTGGGGAHNNMPPWCGVFFLRRTSRLFFTVN